MEYYGNNDWRDYLRRQNELAHFGIPKRSGRYPWGSGENPYHHGSDAPGRRKRKIAKAVALKLGKSKSPTVRGVGQYIHEHTNLDAMEDQDGMDVSLRGLIRAERNKAMREKLPTRMKPLSTEELEDYKKAVNESDGKTFLSDKYDDYEKYKEAYFKQLKSSDDYRKKVKAVFSKDDIDFDSRTLKDVKKAMDTPIDGVSSLSDKDIKTLNDLVFQMHSREDPVSFDFGLSKRDFELKKQALQTLKENEIRNKVHSLYSLEEVEKLYDLAEKWDKVYNFWYESKGTPEQNKQAEQRKWKLEEEMRKIDDPKWEEFAKSMGVEPYGLNPDTSRAYSYFGLYGPSGDKYEVDGWVFELFKDKQRVDKR